MMTILPAAGPLPVRLPAIGELVQVRSRRWLVEEVVPPPEPGHSARVRLACADDDAQGQTLDVFWDCELDRRILEQEGWADLASRGFDAPRRFATCTTPKGICATWPRPFTAPAPTWPSGGASTGGTSWKRGGSMQF